MACEKCWGDAYMRMLGDPSRSQADHYADLLAEVRDGKRPKCTPEQVRGDESTSVEAIDARRGGR